MSQRALALGNDFQARQRMEASDYIAEEEWDPLSGMHAPQWNCVGANFLTNENTDASDPTLFPHRLFLFQLAFPTNFSGVRNVGHLDQEERILEVTYFMGRVTGITDLCMNACWACVGILTPVRGGDRRARYMQRPALLIYPSLGGVLLCKLCKGQSPLMPCLDFNLFHGLQKVIYSILGTLIHYKKKWCAMFSECAPTKQ